MKYDRSTAAVYMDGGRGTVGKSRPLRQRERLFLHKRTALSPQVTDIFAAIGEKMAK